MNKDKGMKLLLEVLEGPRLETIHTVLKGASSKEIGVILVLLTAQYATILTKNNFMELNPKFIGAVEEMARNAYSNQSDYIIEPDKNSLDN